MVSIDNDFMSKARTRIKFCGITRAEDAAFAAELGVDYLGFVQVPNSPRAIAPARAQALMHTLPASVQVVALFQNASIAEVRQSLGEFAPAILQFHGAESPDFCAAFGRPWFKALPMGEPQSYLDWEQQFHGAAALLADSHTLSAGGGSGHPFDWSRIPPAGQRRTSLMLAGGLQAGTVAQAIAQVRPWGVDVSSGIESGTKGMKDHRKMRAFVEAVRLADASLKDT
jgi:phosphoribosylanthranilate isomerase